MKQSNFNAKVVNKMQIKLPSLSVNEGMARAAAAAFVSQLDPTATELADIKCAVSEAVTNCIVHAYCERKGEISITVRLISGGVRICVRDRGCGIEDVRRAREPLFTTGDTEERSGLGFTMMESFMDRVSVRSRKGYGTLVILTKYIGRGDDV